MELKFPPEPLEIKEEVKSFLNRFKKPEAPYWDRIAVWANHLLPKYLWNHWKDELKSVGYTWQEFLRVLSLHTDDFIEWSIYERLSWNELVTRVTNTLREYAPKAEKNK